MASAICTRRGGRFGILGGFWEIQNFFQIFLRLDTLIQNFFQKIVFKITLKHFFLVFDIKN